MARSATSGREAGRDGALAQGWEPIVGSIGPKVRELRQQLGLSLQQLAQQSEVSAAAIHKVERGDMVPTITTLLKLAAALEQPIGHFVEETPAGPVACYIPAADRVALQPPADGVELAGISGAANRFRTAGAVATIAPGAQGSGLQQPGEDLMLVLSGTLAVEVAGEHYTLHKGDALHYPTDRPYRWSNPGRSEARVVWVWLHGS